jgi:SAM-dependent methyltransferase
VVADGCKLDGIADSSCDVCIMSFGMMFMPSPQDAARELVCITKPGGLICIQTWSTPDRSQWHGLVASIMKMLQKAAAASAPAAQSAPVNATTTLSLPFNTPTSLLELMAPLNVETVLVEEHLMLAPRVYQNALEFWNSLQQVSPLAFSQVNAPEKMQLVQEHIGSMSVEQNSMLQGSILFVL